jgi:hypothetical protein
MEIINLTPHAVKIMGKDTKVFAPSGQVARIKESRIKDQHLEGIPLNRKSFGEVEYLPPPAPNKVYIVSSQVVEYLRGQRSDVVAPDDLVRDENGMVIGCKSLWYAQGDN